MRTFLLAFTCFLFIKADAQHTVTVDAGGVLSLHRFPYDSLSPARNARPVEISVNVFANGYYYFSFRNSPLQLKVGLGYEKHDFHASNSSFKLSSVSMTNCYLNFPVGLSYRLGQRRSSTIWVNAEMQLNTGVLLSSHAAFDTSASSTPLTSAQKQDLERQYEHTSSSIIFSLMPRLNTRIRIYRGFGATLDLQPLMFYLNSSNKPVFREGAGFFGSCGLYYNL